MAVIAKSNGTFYQEHQCSHIQRNGKDNFKHNSNYLTAAKLTPACAKLWRKLNITENVYICQSLSIERMKRTLLLTFAALLIISCNRPVKQTAPSFDEVLSTRRSVRSYDATKTISEAEVRTLLTAAQEAPSWANMEPTKYYVAMGEQKRTALLEMIGGNKERVCNAPVLIVSTFETGKSGFFRGQQTNEVGDGWGAYDNGLSNAYLVLQARAMGFDTLIMGMRNADAIRTEFGIPETETIMAVIALGYRADEPNRPVRRELDEVVKFF